MNISFEKSKEKYSYADYLDWLDEERWEIIAGKPYLMSPAPSREHQRISIEIASQLHAYLREGCRRVVAGTGLLTTSSFPIINIPVRLKMRVRQEAASS